jgi:aminomethyltransferase
MKTALYQAHLNQSAKIVSFAGYEMPIQYELGMLKEHEWVRSGNVGIFDVSHMGQFILKGNSAQEFLSYITPTDFGLSKLMQAKYTVLTNKKGGIIDDLIITKINENEFFIVLNAGCKEKDKSWINNNLYPNLNFYELADRSLIAVQGNKAVEVLSTLISGVNLIDLPYMYMSFATLKNGNQIFISRTGYTGEDGFEISINNNDVANFWQDLSANQFVMPIGLGARDSLRLEMGYPLYGHDLNENTSPIEASLSWVISKTNNSFFGSEIVLQQKTQGANKKRMGVKLLDRGIAREGTIIKKDGVVIGELTSGGFSPTIKTSIGQGYFSVNCNIGDNVVAIVREKEIPAIITSPTFVEAKTKAIKKQ